MFKNERMFTIVLTVLATLGLIFFVWNSIEKIKKVSDGFSFDQFALYDKSFYLNYSNDFLKNLGIDSQNKSASYSTLFDDPGDSFLKRTIGERGGYLYRKEFNYPDSLIAVRYFQEMEKHETYVYLDPNTGKPRGFVDFIPENEDRPNVEKEEATKIAETFLTSQNIDLNSLELKDYSSNQIQNRVDHNFTYKVKGSEVETNYGEGYIYYNVSLYGNTVGAYNISFFIPENFNRELDKMASIGDLLSLISWLVTILMSILGLIYTIVAFKSGKVAWKIHSAAFVILTIMLIISIVADYNTFLNSYTTDQILFVSFATYIITALLYGSFLNFVVPLAGMGANYLEQFTNFKISDVKSNLVPSVLKGYLLAFISLGTVTLIYFVGEKYLGVWQVGVTEPSRSFIDYSILLSTIYICLTSSFTEEIIFRYFGFVLFKKYVKYTFLAMLLAVFVWAIGHSNYPVFPVYFRGIELVIDGMIWAYFMLRYNIATTITAHFIYNAFLTCVGLYMTLNPVYLLYATFILILPILVSFIYSKLYLKSSDLVI